jgi:hypothetical protein
VIALDSLLTRDSNPLDCTIGDEVMLLSAQTGMYYALDATAARIWKLLETPTTFGDLCDKLTTEFDVSVDQCRDDVSACLRTLIDDALIHLTTPSA